ncbi:hypothetical protein D3C81_2005990 [compost metagenome]
MRPQIKMARMTYSKPFSNPTPFPPKTLLSIICAKGTKPPIGVNDSCILLTLPVVAAVVTVVNNADSDKLNLTSMPSILP